jgi:acyl carrier protein
LFSSLSSVLGGFAFAAYAAASQYMDAFTGRQQAMTETPWISVNWDGWLTPDLAGQPGNELAMTLAEGLEACRRILALEGVHQVIVSTGDLPARIEKWVQPPAADEASRPESAAADGQTRPDLATAYAAPRDDVEQTIAGLWQTLLGVNGVGIHDDFFDLGGHSLLGTQLVARLRKVFEVELPMRCIFEAKTVADLAGVVKEKQAEQVVDEEMEETLAMLEGLSDEEVAALLAALPEEEA